MPAPLPLSVAVVTLNAETNLPRCLESVQGLAAEIVVLDSGSTDRTAEIACRFGARFETQPWAGFVAQKTRAFGLCVQPWVLNLDADEVVSAQLAESLRNLFSKGEPKQRGFEINRRTFYLGEWVRHAWNPDWVLRLACRDGARWAGHDPHAHLEVAGVTARLSGELLHYSYRSLEDHLNRTIHYARIGADRYEQEGCTVRWHHIIISPWAAFFKKLILKSAWRDGWRGWIISMVTMFGVFAKHAFRLERELVAEEKP